MRTAEALSSCEGKVKVATANGAHCAMRTQTRHRKFKVEPGCELRVYRCKSCHGWHIGNGFKQPRTSRGDPHFEPQP